MKTLAQSLTRTPPLEAAVAGLLAFGLFFTAIGSIPLIGRDEPRFAEASREMLARGDWVVPTFGGVNRYDKPILIYWCTMASYSVLGVNERAARLPSNLAAALVVVLLAWWARRRWGRGAGLAAGWLLAVTLTFHLEARGCTADMVMLLPTVAAMLALAALLEGRGGVGAAIVFWGGLGLSILAKGPVGPMVAAGCGVALWALNRTWRRTELVVLGALAVAGWAGLGPKVLVAPVLWAVVETLRSPTRRATLGRLRWGWGVPLLLVVVLPWAVAAWHATGGEFFQVGIGKHVVARSLKPLESHGGVPGFYVLTGLIAAFPWFALGPAAVRRWWPERRNDSTIRFLLAWLVGPLVVVELVETKLVHYWMGGYPAAVLLIVAWLWARRESGSGASARWLAVLGAVLVGLVPGAVAVHLRLEGLVSLGAVAGILLVSAGLGFAVLWPIHRRRALTVLMAGTAAFELLLFGLFMPRLGHQLVGPRAAQRALAIRQAHEQLVVYKARDDELFFYLPLDAVNVRPQEDLARQVAAGGSFLGIARERDLERFLADHPEARLTVVERVPGVDLGHGRHVRMALFRPAPDSPSSSGGS